MSSFTYTRDRPNAPNNPSVDQPVMKINTNSIDDLIAVDHVSFNANGGGQHEQVTFNANNVPSVPTSPPVLFTNNDAFSIPQLFYYSGIAPRTTDQYKLTTNGSTFLFGGIILKWGSFNPPNGTSIVTFTGLSPANSAFPDNCFTVIVMDNGAPGFSSYRVSSYNATSFTFVNGGAGGRAYSFIAVGN